MKLRTKHYTNMNTNCVNVKPTVSSEYRHYKTHELTQFTKSYSTAVFHDLSKVYTVNIHKSTST